MWNGIIYLRSGRRQPVRLCVPVNPRDIQEDIPLGWCAVCGAEVFHPDSRLCRYCEGGILDEQTETNKPL